jgi:hypothetical protein
MVRADYGRHADVPYLVLGRPRPGRSREGDDGLYYRFAEADGAPCGVTVEGFRAFWLGREGEVAERAAGFLGVPIPDVAEAVRQVSHLTPSA